MIGQEVLLFIKQVKLVKQIKNKKTMSKVTVTANAAGQVVIPNPSKPDYGYMRVESVVTEINGTFMNQKKRSAIIAGETEVLQNYVRDNNLRAGSELPGRIVVKESTTKSFETQEPKRAGADGPVCTIGGQPIYRNVFYTTDETVTDELIQHDNEIVGSSNRVTQNNTAAIRM